MAGGFWIHSEGIDRKGYHLIYYEVCSVLNWL